jgi:hypothetical protein
MHSLLRACRMATMALIAVITLVAAATTSRARDIIGLVLIHLDKAVDSSRLLYPHGPYGLRIGGIDLGSASVVLLDGKAWHLHSSSDIFGTYSGTGIGGTFVGRNQVATLRNEHGVVLTLEGGAVGLQSLNLAGMTISRR